MNEGVVPITRETLEYHIPFASNSSKKHGATCQITQFPLRLSWASTAHKLQGLTLRGTDLVCHGDELMTTIPSANGVAYVMFSRCQSIANLFLSDDFELEMIKCSPAALIETLNLDERCIVKDTQDLKFDIFYINCQNFNHHQLDVKNDILAQQSNIICVVETWMNPDQPIEWPGKHATYASYGNGKGVCVYYTPNQAPFIVGTKCSEKYQLISVIVKENIQLFLIYLSDGCPLNEVTQEIRSLIKPKFNLLIFGDFNFDKSESNILTKFFHSCELDQVINDPTHMAGRTIDHVYINEKMKHETEIVSTFKYYSDHISFNFVFK